MKHARSSLCNLYDDDKKKIGYELRTSYMLLDKNLKDQKPFLSTKAKTPERVRNKWISLMTYRLFL